MENKHLIGKSYTFEDGHKIEIIQIKDTDENLGKQLVTVLLHTGPGIPRKQVLTLNQFIDSFGHLFKDTE